MADDETMRRCLGAMLLEGETFHEDAVRPLIISLGGNPRQLVEEGYVAPRYPGGLVTMTYYVTDKGRQFFLADHTNQEK